MPWGGVTFSSISGGHGNTAVRNMSVILGGHAYRDDASDEVKGYQIIPLRERTAPAEHQQIRAKHAAEGEDEVLRRAQERMDTEMSMFEEEQEKTNSSMEEEIGIERAGDLT